MPERIPVDFFGRPITTAKASKSGPNQLANLKTESDGILSSDVWFKFKEGYNNAVRRNIRVQDLLWSLSNFLIFKYKFYFKAAEFSLN